MFELGLRGGGGLYHIIGIHDLAPDPTNSLIRARNQLLLCLSGAQPPHQSILASTMEQALVAYYYIVGIPDLGPDSTNSVTGPRTQLMLCFILAQTLLELLFQ